MLVCIRPRARGASRQPHPGPMVVRDGVDPVQHAITPRVTTGAKGTIGQTLLSAQWPRREGSRHPGAIEMVDRRLQFLDTFPVATVILSIRSQVGPIEHARIPVKIGVVAVELLQDDR